MPTHVYYIDIAVACTYNGTTYKVNETWVNGRVKLQCEQYGAYRAIGECDVHMLYYKVEL
jgi:hypothetical protein